MTPQSCNVCGYVLTFAVVDGETVLVCPKKDCKLWGKPQ